MKEDLFYLLYLLMGELNASHTGISGGGREAREQGAETHYPGFELEADPNGYYKVAHVYRHGPADKDYVKVKAGDFILAIDGEDPKAGDNYWRHYTTAPGGKIEFTVNSKPTKEGARTVAVTPVSWLLPL